MRVAFNWYRCRAASWRYSFGVRAVDGGGGVLGVAVATLAGAGGGAGTTGDAAGEGAVAEPQPVSQRVATPIAAASMAAEWR